MKRHIHRLYGEITRRHRESFLNRIELDREWVKFFGAGCGAISCILFMHFFFIAYNQPTRTMTMDINSLGEAEIEFILIWPFGWICLYGFAMQWEDFMRKVDGKGKGVDANESGRVEGISDSLPPASTESDSPQGAGESGEEDTPTKSTSDYIPPAQSGPQDYEKCLKCDGRGFCIRDGGEK